MKKKNLQPIFTFAISFCIITQFANAQQATRPSAIIQIQKVDINNPMPFNAASRSIFDEETEKRDFKKRNIRKQNTLSRNQQENESVLNVSKDKKPCPMSPLVVTGFEGNRLTPFYLPPVGYYASECNIAISNTGKVVSISNGWMYYFNENGTIVFSDSLYHFGNSLIDCHVVYDPKKDRFVFLSSYGFCNFVNVFQIYGNMIAFSKTNDPLDGWNNYFIPDSNFQDNSVGDYPLLAISDDEAFITSLYFNNGGVIKHAQVIQLDKNAGYAGATFINIQQYDAPFTGGLKGTLISAQGGSSTYGPNMYFMMANETGQPSDKYFVYEVTNTIASGQAILKRYGPVTTNIIYSGTGPSYQPGGIQLVDLNAPDANDDIVQNAFYENGIMQFCQPTKANGKASIYIGRISGIPNNLSCTAKTISDPNLYLSFPSIAYAGNSSSDNSAIVGIEHTGENTYPGLSAVYVNSNFDISALTTVKAGADTINGLWGDYSGICRRYNHPGECWFEGQYGSTTFPNINWIAKLKAQECPMLNVTRATDIKSSIYTDITLSVSPNPFSSSASISFSVLQSEKVSIKIFDITGRLIKTLVNAKMEQGNHQLLIWNATDDNGKVVPTGTYFLKMEEGNKSETRKLVVIK